MTGPRDELTDALRRLRGAVRDRILVPPAAMVRGRATRALRVRRTATALVAAAAVAAVSLGGAQLARLTGQPVPPPAATPTPTAPAPTASPVPPPVPAVTPSPRPAPLPPAAPPDDPIAEVDWYRATITLPPSEYCPSGPVTFAPSDHEDHPATVALVNADGKSIWIWPEETATWAYGDITGDGRIEVIMEVECFLSADGSDLPTGHGGELMAVSRADDGTLTGLGRVGPRDAIIHSVWVSESRVLMDGERFVANPEDDLPPAMPGLALNYRWDGSRFLGWEPAAEYPPIVPLDAGGSGPPVRPRAVAAGLGCPDAELRFTREEHDLGGTAVAAGATFVIPSTFQQQHLFDLDRTGGRLLVTALRCTAADGWSREGLAVFERAGPGWQGISVLTPPPGLGLFDAGSWGNGPEGTLEVSWARPTGVGEWEVHPVRYRWSGTVLEPVGG
jgi:hypothetical protein